MAHDNRDNCGLPIKSSADYHIFCKTIFLHCCSNVLQSESENTQLLYHPLVTSLLKHKWDSFGHKLFFANLFIYVVFLVCLTGFALMALNPLEQTCK